MRLHVFIAGIVLAFLYTVLPLHQRNTRAGDPQRSSSTDNPTTPEPHRLLQRMKALDHRVACLEKHLLKLPADAAKPLGKVGEIKIIGNYETSGNVILAQLPFRPGSSFSQGDLDLAVRRLELLHIFKSDEHRLSNPTVESIPSATGGYLDILVRIREKE
jgi:hypothetical protein